MTTMTKPSGCSALRGAAALSGAVLLGTTFLSAPASAQSVDELRAQIESLQQRLDQIETQQMASPVVAPAQAVTAGDFPGSIKIPGTNTSFKVGGYVKLDAMYSTQQGLGDSVFAPGVPVPGSLTAAEFSDGQFRLHARQTRINIATQTPSDLGLIKTYWEGDFIVLGIGNELVSNLTPLRLRHAYGTIGNLLLGQTWSNFMHLGALADTVDFAGPSGVWFARQAQIRYTVPFTGGWKIDLSIENPQSAAFNTPAGFATGFVGSGLGGAGFQEDRIPDFTAKVTYGGDWGFVSVAGLLGALDINTGPTTFAGTNGIPVSVSDTELFWAVHGGARVNTWRKDSIYGAISFADGGGRTQIPIDTAGFLDISGPTPEVETLEVFGGHIGYEHWWTDNLYSNVAYGYQSIDFPDGAGDPNAPFFIGFVEETQSLHVNLQWVPVPRVTLGVEWIWVDNEYNLLPGAVDDDNSAQRFQFGARFNF